MRVRLVVELWLARLWAQLSALPYWHLVRGGCIEDIGEANQVSLYFIPLAQFFMANISLSFASPRLIFFSLSKMSNEDRLHYYVCITYLHIEQLASLWPCRLQYDQTFGTGEEKEIYRHSWESSIVNASIIQYRVFWAKFRANDKHIMISLN